MLSENDGLRDSTQLRYRPNATAPSQRLAVCSDLGASQGHCWTGDIALVETTFIVKYVQVYSLSDKVSDKLDGVCPLSLMGASSPGSCPPSSCTHSQALNEHCFCDVLNPCQRYQGISN